MSNWYIIPSDNDLMHHGIKGQKWGVRNGPPYPLDGSTKSHKSSNKSTKNSQNKVKYHGLALNKEALVYDAIVISVSAISAAIGLCASMHASKKKKEIDKEIENNTNVDKKTGLKLKQNECSEIEDMRKVNPGYDPKKSNTTTNCGLCSVVYEMRRRGYDVTAKQKRSTIEYDQFSKIFNSKDEKLITNVKKVSKDQARNIISNLQNRENQRGIMLMQWSTYSGHALNYEVKNNKVIIRDSQTMNVLDNDSSIIKMLTKTKDVSIVRTDNAKNIDYNTVKNVCVDDVKKEGK